MKQCRYHYSNACIFTTVVIMGFFKKKEEKKINTVKTASMAVNRITKKKKNPSMQFRVLESWQCLLPIETIVIKQL